MMIILSFEFSVSNIFVSINQSNKQVIISRDNNLLTILATGMYHYILTIFLIRCFLYFLFTLRKMFSIIKISFAFLRKVFQLHNEILKVCLPELLRYKTDGSVQVWFRKLLSNLKLNQGRKSQFLYQNSKILRLTTLLRYYRVFYYLFICFQYQINYLCGENQLDQCLYFGSITLFLIKIFYFHSLFNNPKNVLKTPRK